jgi:RHS repeat-associated protein
VRASNGTTPTNYTYTGQYSNMGDFGLMFYNARWYDPAIGRFAQADSIVPGGVQGYDRYAYVNNNPVRYNDPSGHSSCDYEDDDGNCQSYTDEDYIASYLKIIKERYDWVVEGKDWTLKDLETIYHVGLDIENYVNGLTNGKGNSWMHTYLGGTTITRGGGDSYATYPWWVVGKNTIYISAGAVHGSTLAHEFGHIWDINTSSNRPCACGVGGGVGDQLNDAIGGNWLLRDLHFRWMNDRNNVANFTIPKTVTYGGFEYDNWFTKNSGYGNNGTADYLAESFRWNIYDHNSVPTVASLWVDFAITAQANALP